MYAELRFHKAGWYRPLASGEWVIWKWFDSHSDRHYSTDAEWFSTYDDGLAFLESHTPDGKTPLKHSGLELADVPLLDEPASVQEGVLYRVGIEWKGETRTHFEYFWIFAFTKEQAFEAVAVKMELEGVKKFTIVNWYGSEYHVLTLV